MEEEILREILQEMKGMRTEQAGTLEEMKGMRAELGETNNRLVSLEQTTNKRFESLEQTTNKRFESLEQTTNKHFESLEQTTNRRFESLEQTTNKRFESLEETTNKRFDSLEAKFDGLATSVQFLTQGFSDVRYELVEIKKLLATRVIWNNDTVSLQVKEGETIYGVIRKEDKKE